MEAAYRLTVQGLRFCAHIILHSIVVMVLDPKFNTKYTNGVGDGGIIFLFPYLSPEEYYEAALLTRKWDAFFGGGKITYFYDTTPILGCQKVSLEESWDEAVSQLEV